MLYIKCPKIRRHECIIMFRLYCVQMKNNNGWTEKKKKNKSTSTQVIDQI